MAHLRHVLWGMAILGSLWTLPVYAWSGKHENKPLAELERLVEGELAHEAAAVCRGSTVTGPATGDSPALQKDALSYLNTLSRYGRRLNRGTTPWWSIATYKAVQAGDRSQCDTIWQQVVKDASIEGVPAEKAPSPTAPQQPPG